MLSMPSELSEIRAKSTLDAELLVECLRAWWRDRGAALVWGGSAPEPLPPRASFPLRGSPSVRWWCQRLSLDWREAPFRLYDITTDVKGQSGAHIANARKAAEAAGRVLSFMHKGPEGHEMRWFCLHPGSGLDGIAAYRAALKRMDAEGVGRPSAWPAPEGYAVRRRRGGSGG